LPVFRVGKFFPRSTINPKRKAKAFISQKEPVIAKAPTYRFDDGILKRLIPRLGSVPSCGGQLYMPLTVFIAGHLRPFKDMLPG